MCGVLYLMMLGEWPARGLPRVPAIPELCGLERQPAAEGFEVELDARPVAVDVGYIAGDVTEPQVGAGQHADLQASFALGLLRCGRRNVRHAAVVDVDRPVDVRSGNALVGADVQVASGANDAVVVVGTRPEAEDESDLIASALFGSGAAVRRVLGDDRHREPATYSRDPDRVDRRVERGYACLLVRGMYVFITF